jgi:ribosomal protein S17E
VVASEDNLLKIYNQKLEEKFRENMLKIEPIEEGSKKVRESKGDR